MGFSRQEYWSGLPLHIYMCVCVHPLYIYTHTHIYIHYLTIKKNEIMPFVATWIKLELITLSEVSQKEKDKYHMISFICEI